jgi:hypothetical protein
MKKIQLFDKAASLSYIFHQTQYLQSEQHGNSFNSKNSYEQPRQLSNKSDHSLGGQESVVALSMSL